MKLQVLIFLLLTQACTTVKSEFSKPPLMVAKKTENRLDSGIKKLSNLQQERLSALLSEIPVALEAYQNKKDSNEIIEKCSRVISDIDALNSALPPGIFKNTLQQGRDALNLAYLFRFEKSEDTEISPELRKKVIDTYKIGDVPPEKRADKLFNFAQAHFEIAARIAKDDGIKPR